MGLWNRTNLIISSDHGHHDIDYDKIVYIEDYVDKEQFVWKEPNFWPIGCRVEDLMEKLKLMPHCKVFQRQQLADRGYSKHSRIGPIVVIPEEGGQILSSRSIDGAKFDMKSAHVYDHQHPSMWPLFVATGPKFKQNFELQIQDPLHLVDVAGIAAKCLSIKLESTDSVPDRYLKLFKN